MREISIDTAETPRRGAGIIRCVPKGFADAVHGGIQAVLEVSEGVGGPEFLLQLFAGDQFSGAKEQGLEDLEGLCRQPKRTTRVD
jgi:hypothetical protein